MLFSITDAYRRDRAAHGGAFSSGDDQWILVGSIIIQSVRAPTASQRLMLRRAATAAAGCFSPGELSELARREWNSRPRRADALILLAAAIQEAGALYVARAIVEALLETSLLLTDVQCGRLMARRAQLAHRMNDADLAAAHYAELERFARAKRIVELRARAALGLATLAQFRGNYPEMLRLARIAHRLARAADLPRLVSRSAYALMVAAAQMGQHSESLVSAWEMYRAARRDPEEQASSLVALGQLLLRLDQPDAAYNAFSMVLERRISAREMLRALSGLAAAAASRSPVDRDQVRWAASEVRRLRGPASPRYDLANAELECAAALDAIGDRAVATELRHDALALGEAHGFHQVVLEADAEKPAVERAAKLAPRASAVIRHFADAPSPRLPLHVELAGATR